MVGRLLELEQQTLGFLQIRQVFAPDFLQQLHLQTHAQDWALPGLYSTRKKGVVGYCIMLGVRCANNAGKNGGVVVAS